MNVRMTIKELVPTKQKIWFNIPGIRSFTGNIDSFKVYKLTTSALSIECSSQWPCSTKATKQSKIRKEILENLTRKKGIKL